MERVQKAEIATLTSKEEQGKGKGHIKEEKRIKMVQVIQNMVRGNINFDSVSLFTIILSDAIL
jgi:hypothetical protein